MTVQQLEKALLVVHLLVIEGVQLEKIGRPAKAYIKGCGARPRDVREVLQAIKPLLTSDK